MFTVYLGVFEDGRYWNVFAEYAKNTTDEILVKITVENHGSEEARLHVLPTLWFRNTWSWGCDHVSCSSMTDSKTKVCKRKPIMVQTAPKQVECSHDSLGKYTFSVSADPDGLIPELIFTENETNSKVIRIHLYCHTSFITLFYEVSRVKIVACESNKKYRLGAPLFCLRFHLRFVHTSSRKFVRQAQDVRKGKFLPLGLANFSFVDFSLPSTETLQIINVIAFH